MQRNAPGTQGYNLYPYVANNPTTWVDPSGHSALSAVAAYVIANPGVLTEWVLACAAGALAIAGGGMYAFAGSNYSALALAIAGDFFVVCAMAPITLGIYTIVCFLIFDCQQAAFDMALLIRQYGSSAWEGAWDWGQECCPVPPFSFPDMPDIPNPFAGSGSGGSAGGQGGTSDASGQAGDMADVADNVTTADLGGDVAFCPPPSDPSKTVKHHIFPKRFQDRFEAAGIEIDDYVVEITYSLHLMLHGCGQRGGLWNAEWESFFDDPLSDTSPEGIWAFAREIMGKYGVPDLPVVP